MNEDRSLPKQYNAAIDASPKIIYHYPPPPLMLYFSYTYHFVGAFHIFRHQSVEISVGLDSWEELVRDLLYYPVEMTEKFS